MAEERDPLELAEELAKKSAELTRSEDLFLQKILDLLRRDKQLSRKSLDSLKEMHKEYVSDAPKEENDQGDADVDEDDFV